MLFKLAPLAFTLCQASWETIQTNVDFVLHNNSLLIDFAMSLAENYGVATDRALTQADMSMLNMYGCWCYFEDDHGKGRGQPIDELDAQCKILQDGYYCAIQDAADLGQSCTPWEVIYNSAIGIGIGSISIPNVIAECDTANPSDGCGNAACKIEGYFVVGFLQKILTGSQINQDYRHLNGFDKMAMCPISGNGLKSEKSCCGDHPKRFPFKNYGGNRECCQGHTFNTNLYTCCADGTVKMSC